LKTGPWVRFFFVWWFWRCAVAVLAELGGLRRSPNPPYVFPLLRTLTVPDFGVFVLIFGLVGPTNSF
jgi:hypothetical protein